MDCIFCKILNNEIPSNKIFENENFIAILDAFPANYGHTLVIPKKHYENIFDIDENLLKEGFLIAKKVAKAIKDALNISDINIIQNNGKLAGQTVFHFHIHIVPRLENDNVVISSKSIDVDKEKNTKVIEKIKQNLL